ncbi:hypothetical protein [Microtetraspora sp. NBRC 16547]|uniref:hypothetical protein n=1 Tax=Microtetraspora sp. NBRC 16547 TaxID=3030993 RepID=UPI0024A254C2|nr:hypothetical protein [Microtetraspora sp. NBRC 16547]GLW99236.1 hypothetical protein Misp02_33230 [Microtetraspora sp. NBRC 16547]
MNPRDNLDVATSAREMADNAPPGSLHQAAAASVAISCATARDIDQARVALDGITPDEVRRAAIELFDRLAATGDEPDASAP